MFDPCLSCKIMTMTIKETAKMIMIVDLSNLDGPSVDKYQKGDAN